MKVEIVAKNLSAIFRFLLLVAITSCGKNKKTDEAAQQMQQFVIDISNYAKAQNPHFIIIPQNGVELAFNNTDINSGISVAYLNAVDAFGNEEVFTNSNGELKTDDERKQMLEELVKLKPCFVSEFVNNNSKISAVVASDTAEHFIPFVRETDDYDYLKIPNTIVNENANDIDSISQVKNYLYLISSDNYSNNKHSMIQAIRNTNFDLVLIDLFSDTNTSFTAQEVDSIKTKLNGGKRLVISYISIGSAEKYRYYWQSDWKVHNPSWLKKKYNGYPDEVWVEFWNQQWRDNIFGNNNSYIKKIIDAGFDGTYLDNVEAYYSLYHNN